MSDTNPERLEDDGSKTRRLPSDGEVAREEPIRFRINVIPQSPEEGDLATPNPASNYVDTAEEIERQFESIRLLVEPLREPSMMLMERAQEEACLMKRTEESLRILDPGSCGSFAFEQSMASAKATIELLRSYDDSMKRIQDLVEGPPPFHRLIAERRSEETARQLGLAPQRPILEGKYIHGEHPLPPLRVVVNHVCKECGRGESHIDATPVEHRASRTTDDNANERSHDRGDAIERTSASTMDGDAATSIRCTYRLVAGGRRKLTLEVTVSGVVGPQVKASIVGKTAAMIAKYMLERAPATVQWSDLVRAGVGAGHWAATSPDSLRRAASRIRQKLPDALRGYWNLDADGARWALPATPEVP